MMNLNREQNKNLLEILKKIFVGLQNHDKKMLLDFCCSEEFGGHVMSDENPFDFPLLLLEKLKKKSMLHTFFDNYLGSWSYRLDEDEICIIETILKTAPPSQEIKNEVSTQISNPPNLKLGKDFIADFDIEGIEAEFIKGLVPSEGIFAFYFEYPSDKILEDYILHRLKGVYEKVKRKNRKSHTYHITLTENDASSPTRMYEKFEHEIDFPVCELSQRGAFDDYIVSILNRRIPKKFFKKILTCFWEELNNHTPVFRDTNRRLILILMNCKPAKLKFKRDRFRIMEIPKDVNIRELKRHVKDELEKSGVHDDHIHNILDRLSNQLEAEKGDFSFAYDQLSRIESKLKGRIRNHE